MFEFMAGVIVGVSLGFFGFMIAVVLLYWKTQ